MNFVKSVFSPIGKAANNIAIICKKCHVFVILKEIEILDPGNETYEKKDVYNKFFKII